MDFKDDDTVLIFQKPELYFFPHLKGVVFSPFCVPQKSVGYLLYKVMHMLRIPARSVFWGDWKEKVRYAKKAIIFDYGYQAGMETYIKKVNPNCEVYLFFWNIITKKRKNHKLFTDKDAIYSTDKGCCAEYNLKYNHMFYTRDYYRPYDAAHKDRLFFMGTDKGRAGYIFELKKILEDAGLTCDIRLLSDRRGRRVKKKFPEIFTDKTEPYDKYLKDVNASGVLLDVNQKGQQALTMRVMEAIYFSKKLITNNSHVAEYDFYDKNNIYILPNDLSKASSGKIKEFLERPFCPYGEETLSNYDYAHWKEGFKMQAPLFSG